MGFRYAVASDEYGTVAHPVPVQTARLLASTTWAGLDSLPFLSPTSTITRELQEPHSNRWWPLHHIVTGISLPDTMQ